MVKWYYSSLIRNWPGFDSRYRYSRIGEVESRLVHNQKTPFESGFRYEMDLEVDLDKILIAKKNGILIPYTTMQVARETGVPFYALCAVLEKESGGGKNIFGHDPTIFVGAGEVTKTKYLDYKKQRDASKAHRKMQGVGPMQLTYYTYQDEADALGGCWEPYYNVTVGAKFIQRLRDKYGKYDWVSVGEHYNGARAYGVDLDKKIVKWKKTILG